MAFINIGFFSKTLGMEVTCDVILPQPVHPENAQDELPVLWLLHGAYGNYADWMRRTSIERYVANTGLCVVMPSAQNSDYTDMAHGGRFYTYISSELPERMRSFFPISQKREDNFICGLSMGGAGAFKIGLSKPDHYAAIGCLSAGAQNKSGKLIKMMGSLIYGDTPYEGTYMDPLSQADKILAAGGPFPRIYHTCGSEDSLLVNAHEARDYFQAILGNPFDYVYEEDEGAHTWGYWDEHIRRFLQYLHVEKKPDIFY